MNKDIAQYRRIIKKNLHCNATTRAKLLAQFEVSLSPLLEDHPAPTYAQLEAAFGPPAEMAIILMEGVSPKDQRRYYARKTLLKLLAGLAATLLIVFAIYVFFEKEYSNIQFNYEVESIDSSINCEEG